MSLITRLDGRTKSNSSIEIKNNSGEVLAKVTLLDNSGTTLEVSTLDGLYIEKPSGWNSKLSRE
jgi:hypothetical protein